MLELFFLAFFGENGFYNEAFSNNTPILVFVDITLDSAHSRTAYTSGKSGVT